MQIASSANRTCSEFRSASLYTATVRIPISLHALITRSAISPRLAINTLRNMLCPCSSHFNQHRNCHPSCALVFLRETWRSSSRPLRQGSCLFFERRLLHREEWLPILHRLFPLYEHMH